VVAPVVFHCKVDDRVNVMVVGFAVKEVMVGSAALIVKVCGLDVPPPPPLDAGFVTATLAVPTDAISEAKMVAVICVEEI